MPKELSDYIRSLPSSLVNNSREIVRQTWERVRHLHPCMAANIMNTKFGLGLDPDFEPGRDDGEPPR